MCGKLIRRSIYLSAIKRLHKMTSSELYVNSMEDLLQFFPMIFEASSYVSLDYFGYQYYSVESSLSHGLARSWTRWESLCDNVCTVRLTLLKIGQSEGLCDGDIFKLEKLFFPTIVNVIKNEAIKFPCDEQEKVLSRWLNVFDISKALGYLLNTLGEDAWRYLSLGGCFNNHMSRVTRHIAVTIPRYFCGGTERVLMRLFEIWRSTFPALKITLFTFTQPTQLDYGLPSAVDRIYLDVTRPDYIDNFADYILSMRIDTVLTGNIGAWESNKLAAKAKLMGCRTIGMMHGSFAYFMTYIGDGNLSRKYCLSVYDYVTTVSDFNARVWRELGIRRCIFVRNPLSMLPSEIVHGKPVGKKVLYIGRLSKEKNLEKIIRMFSLVQAKCRDAILYIVGEVDPGMDWYKDQLICLAKVCGVDDAVRFEGFKDDVRPYLQSAATVVLASRYEGSPVSLIEAKQFAVPAVIMDLPYLDLVGVDNGCVVVPQDDEGAMAREVLRMLTDPDWQHKMATRAKMSLRGYSDDSCAKMWSSLFQYTKNELGEGSAEFSSRDTSIILSSLNTLCGFFAMEKMQEKFAYQRQLGDLSNKYSEAAQEKLAYQQQLGDLSSRYSVVKDERAFWYEEFCRLEKARSYQIGRMVTWPLRMVRNSLFVLRDEGFVSFCRRVPRKIINLKRRFWG